MARTCITTCNSSLVAIKQGCDKAERLANRRCVVSDNVVVCRDSATICSMPTAPPLEPQSTHRVLMIRPAHFAGNVQTAPSNRFQDLSVASDAAPAQALREFDALVQALRDNGIAVHVFDDTLKPHKPDAVFPNNWVSFHGDGTAVLYPMLAPNRRLERRMDILESLSAQGLRIARTIDFTAHEADEHYLEGTGSLVLDRVHRIAYACLSPRTDIEVLGEFAQRLDYELVTFDATDAAGEAIYHTNVLLCIGTRFAVICAEAIAAHERDGVLQALRGSGHEVIEISRAQMAGFAGNVLELRNSNDELRIALSQRAFDAFTPEQRERVRQLAGPLLPVAVPTIERLGGGSVRCMLAEIFLPQK